MSIETRSAVGVWSSHLFVFARLSADILLSGHVTYSRLHTCANYITVSITDYIPSSVYTYGYSITGMLNCAWCYVLFRAVANYRTDCMCFFVTATALPSTKSSSFYMHDVTD